MRRLLLVLCFILSQCSCKKDIADSFKVYFGSAQINGVYYEDNSPFEKQAMKDLYLPFGGSRFVCYTNIKGLKTFFLQLDLINPEVKNDSFIMMAAFSLLEGEKFPEFGKKYDIVYCSQIDEKVYPIKRLRSDEWFYDATYALRNNNSSIIGVAPVYNYYFNDGMLVSTQGFVVFDAVDAHNRYLGKFVLSNAPESSSPDLCIEGDFKVELTSSK